MLKAAGHASKGTRYPCRGDENMILGNSYKSSPLLRVDSYGELLARNGVV